MPSTAIYCSSIIDEVDESERHDWEDTGREERHWMQVARELAKGLMEAKGYVKGS